jgi:hypothetical protein
MTYCWKLLMIVCTSVSAFFLGGGQFWNCVTERTAVPVMRGVNFRPRKEYPGISHLLCYCIPASEVCLLRWMSYQVPIIGIFWAALGFKQLHVTCSRKFSSLQLNVIEVMKSLDLRSRVCHAVYSFISLCYHSLYCWCWTGMSEDVAVPRAGMLSHWVGGI